MNKGYCYQSPVGPLRIVESEKGICEVRFSDDMHDIVFEKTPLIAKTCQQLDGYFAGTLKSFSVPLDIQGTDFQVTTWKALLTIGYGQTCSYKQLATIVGNEKACRAVGNANNKNKIVIIIPCHRVIGTNGKMVGYGGGVAIKEYLLALERQQYDS